MNKTKIIAMYLPQFHCIPENDEFWGKGFTDWVTVKKAKPLFEGHQQPKVPLNNNYYDLSIKENVVWQANLAKKSGIYGFGVYHYWFNNEKNLLTKPAEILRDLSEEESEKYFLVWDNCLWKRSWSNVKGGNAWSPNSEVSEEKEGPEILIPYILGGFEDWKNHYNYIRTHFISENYIKIENKPVFIIINYDEHIKEMCTYWDKLAKADGFDGVFFIFRNHNCEYAYNYEPHYNGWYNNSIITKIKKRIVTLFKGNPGFEIYDYDAIWKNILHYYQNKCPDNVFACGFVNYDDSPRRGNNGSKLFVGFKPEKFERYFSQLYNISCQKDKEFLFLTAWNEWGEGAYIEPDNVNGYKILEIIKRISS